MKTCTSAYHSQAFAKCGQRLQCRQYSRGKKASTKKLGFPPREVSFELFPCTSCYILSLKTKPKSMFSQELSRCLGMIC